MHLAVSAVGVDRPGIVAAVSRVLFEQGGNIEDSRMALLGGHFAMMLIVAAPDQTTARLENALVDATAGMDLIITVRPVAETPHHHADGDGYVLTVYGADRPGIVADVTGALAASGANITDLATHVAEGDVYIMIIELRTPAGADASAIESAVRDAAAGVDISFQPLDTETL